MLVGSSIRVLKKNKQNKKLFCNVSWKLNKGIHKWSHTNLQFSLLSQALMLLCIIIAPLLPCVTSFMNAHLTQRIKRYLRWGQFDKAFTPTLVLKITKS